MSNMPLHAERALLRVSVDTLVAEHGTWTVVKAAVAALVRHRRRPQRLQPQMLPGYLRRDLGLPPAVDPPGHWTHSLGLPRA